MNKLHFLYCESNDIVDAVFITAHINDIYILSALRQVYESRKIIANTCIWERLAHKKLLHKLYKNNSNKELYYAKQELFIDPMRVLRQATTLHNIGQFGFQLSLSKRELFMNRLKDLEEAVKKSFEYVSLILLPGE